MPKTTYIYTKSSSDDKWFEDHYADDAEVMDLYNYYINFYRSKTHCTLDISTENATDSLTAYVCLEYPDDHEDFDSEVQADLKLTNFFGLVNQYYSQPGRSMQMIVE